MDICYVDESGSAELLCATTPASTPAFVIAGLIVPQGHQKHLVWDFLQTKKEHSPSLESVRLSTVISYELKGADLRQDLRQGRRRAVRRSIHLLDRLFHLLEKHECKVIARIIVKDVDVPLDDRVVYSSAISWMCLGFHHYVKARGTEGLVVLDSRTKVKNTPNTNVITTQRYRHGGDPFPSLAEVPVFGHSDSHVALQLADLLASAVLFPMACHAYCHSLEWNHHPNDNYGVLVDRFGPRLQALQHRYYEASTGLWKGGIWASGGAGGLPPMFKQARRPPALTVPVGVLPI